MSSEETANTTEKKKTERRSHKRLICFIIAALAVVAAVIAVIVIINLNHGEDDKTVFDTDAFFLPENEKTDAKYALFRNNGERLTDFQFNGSSEFVNGYAAVRNNEGKYGIIDHNGKMTVDFSDDSMQTLVGFYEIVSTEGEESSKKLILGNGREIATDYKSLISDHSSPYVIVENDDNYRLYNVFGDKLAEFNKDEEPQIASYSSTTISYVRTKEGITLLNNKALKPMITHLSDKKYEIETSNKDRSIVVLRDKDAKDGGNYAVYRDGKITEYGDKCKSISLQSEASSGRTFLTCKTDKKSLLIRNGEVSDISTDNYDNEYRVYDENHYAKFDKESKHVDFYVNGEKKASADASYAPSASYKGYYLRNNEKKTVSLYDLNGNQIYALNETSYGDLAGLDKNDNILVRDPNQEMNERYYLANSKGETISGKYSYITNHGAYYTAKHSDKETMSLLDKDGQAIITGKYSDFSFYDDDKVIFARSDSDKYTFIDLDNKTEKFSVTGSVYYNRDGYIKVIEKEKVTYYTAKGEKIHEYNRN